MRGVSKRPRSGSRSGSNYFSFSAGSGEDRRADDQQSMLDGQRLQRSAVEKATAKEGRRDCGWPAAILCCRSILNNARSPAPSKSKHQRDHTGRETLFSSTANSARAPIGAGARHSRGARSTAFLREGRVRRYGRRGVVVGGELGRGGMGKEKGNHGRRPA
ncbi:unnamed protein product, partial [Ectocarpus sp. 13 AM-2016]